MEYILPPGIKLFNTRRDIVSNLPTAPSDNRRAKLPQGIIMKKIVSICCILFSCLSFRASALDFPKISEITYEWLSEEGNRTGYTDHVHHFCELFKQVNVKNFLEFGLGFSTKYFLDHCQKVISVEFITEGYGPDWMKTCLHAYAEFPHWIPIAYFSSFSGDYSWAPYKYFGSEQVHTAASYQCSSHKNYALLDASYLKELDTMLTNLIKCHQIDCAFVDAGIYLRGDLVSLLFHKVPIILAHDTMCRQLNMQEDVYGYSRIITPVDYEEIAIASGKGTTIWIHKQPSLEGVIQAMKTYAQIN